MFNRQLFDLIGH